MLRIGDPARLGRRDFLQIGGLALGGLSLSSLIPQVATAAAGKPVTDKAVVFVFLHGGPSQFETFDPKMTAPAEIRSATGEIQTALPGVTFGSSFPKLAKLADRLAVVRSYVPGDASHNIKPVVSKDSFDANLGSVSAPAAGGNHPVSGMPSNVLLFPRAVDPAAEPGVMNFGNFGSPGPFGSAAVPFQADGGGNLKADLRLS